MTEKTVATVDQLGKQEKRLTQRQRTWRRFSSHKGALLGIAIIVLLVFIALTAQWFAPYNPNETNLRLRGASPSAEHIFGNDDIGRDILSRIMYGSRVALMVGIISTTIAVTIGVLVGS